MAIQTFVVKGMTCGHCVGSVTDEVTKLPGVVDVQVELSTGEVTVESDAPLDMSDVDAAVDEAGYEVVS